MIAHDYSDDDDDWQSGSDSDGATYHEVVMKER
eukprot:CAMPEP_0198269772 /NCGR_PEP_ID=MMETSP1447-20131203/42518_1 /TAXON_ID=420782 /ORGANISM="Chaetoceros dichaeta, Strain CCMP1751" /LENGTH=32 /DNA_ID= /DNA_START= /DNA_END= /DNA_ORIENTATION=